MRRGVARTFGRGYTDLVLYGQNYYFFTGMEYYYIKHTGCEMRVVSNIDDAVAFLKRHLNISYKIETIRRENIIELPEDALREAIVNAVCHRDYFEKGARVMVEIFDDRVEITSPGGVCKGITSENFGKISITRNSIVASMLYRIDYIEQMGTGIARMKKAAQDAHIAPPEFTLHDFFKVIFMRSQIDLSGGNDGGNGGNDGGNGGNDGGNQQLIIELLSNEPTINTSAMSERTKIPLRTVERIISELKKSGIITRIGTKRSGHWEITRDDT